MLAPPWIPVPPQPLLDAAHPEGTEHSLFEAAHVARAFAAIDAAARRGEPFDLVHDHSGYTALAMANRLDIPLVHAVHGPFNADTSSPPARPCSRWSPARPPGSSSTAPTASSWRMRGRWPPS